jgi:hypothetical protein
MATDQNNDGMSAPTWRANGPGSPTKAKSWRPQSSVSTGSDEDSSYADKVPINVTGERVDLPLPSISPVDYEEYATRISEAKVCNDYVLGQGCDKDNCSYDHGEVAPNVVNVLRGVVRSKLKCPKRGECRTKLCYRSHPGVKGERSGEDEGIEWVDAEDQQ